MNDLHPGIVTIHAAKAQINDHLFRRPADIFEQDVGLLELRRENVTIVGLPGKVHAPTIRPPLWVTAMLALTPNS